MGYRQTPPALIDTANIADDAVTTAKLDDAAVTTAKLDDAAVTTDKIADAAVTLAKLSAELAALPMGNDAFTKVLLHFDGADASTTFTDVAYGALTHAPHVWTASGDAQIDTAQSKFGGASGLFDGTGDFISRPDHADFAIGDQDFTLEFFARNNGAAAATGTGAGQVDGSATAAGTGAFIQQSSAGIWAGFVSDGSSLNQIGSPSVATDDGAFHHIAMVRNGGVFSTYIDGILDASETIAVTIHNPSTDFTIGARASGSSAFNGWIDEFRLSVGIARWTANFTPPTLPYGPTP